MPFGSSIFFSVAEIVAGGDTGGEFFPLFPPMFPLPVETALPRGMLYCVLDPGTAGTAEGAGELTSGGGDEDDVS